jgi:purine-binding chemotaxis protein CheW
MKPGPVASDLRAAFDGSFAEARRDAEPREDILAIQVGGSPYAIRLREIASLFADRAITALPTHRRDVIGIAGFRGAFVPVFDLASLLGHPLALAPRWLVIVADAPIALAFEGFDQHLRVSRDAVVPYAGTDRSPAHVREVIRTSGPLRALIGVASLIEAITRPLGET